MSLTELPKTYEPHAIEAKWYPRWEAAGHFAAGVKVAGAQADMSAFAIQFHIELTNPAPAGIEGNPIRAFSATKIISEQMQTWVAPARQ